MKVQASTARGRVPSIKDLGLKPVAKRLLINAAQRGFITPKDIARMFPISLAKNPGKLRAKVIQFNAYLGLIGIIAIADNQVPLVGLGIKNKAPPKQRGRIAKKMDQVHDGTIEEGSVLSLYMRDVKKYNQIPHKELVELALRVQNDDDTKARNQIISSFLPFAVMVARRYRGQGLEYMDLIQEANKGLIKAAEKFEPERGYHFGTYAMWWIRQSVVRAIQDYGKMVRIPVHLQDKRSKVLKASTAITQKYGREATVAEIAKMTSFTEKEVNKILRLTLLNTIYLDDLVENEREQDAIDFHPSLKTTVLNPESYTLAKSEYKRAQEELMEFVELIRRLNISKLIRRSFFKCYGLDGSLYKKTLSELSAEDGVTHQAINFRIKRVWMALDKVGETADEPWLFNLIERLKDLQDLVGVD